MIRQYNAQRFRYRGPHRVGTVAVGTIAYLWSRREPWIITAWLNRKYYPCVAGRPATTYMLGGHLAVVKSLRSNEVKRVADWLLLACEDAGLTR